MDTETQNLIEEVAEEYKKLRRNANSYIPNRHDKGSEFLEAAEITLKYAQKAEKKRTEFIQICRENNWMCECWKRKKMGRWKMSNKNKVIPEDNNYIYINPETPCPNCGKLVPKLNEA